MKTYLTYLAIGSAAVAIWFAANPFGVALSFSLWCSLVAAMLDKD